MTSDDHLVPYVTRPVDVMPGRPSHYATTMSLGGYGTGIVVTSHEGRPTKIEGNPEHPASLGSCGVFEQAILLQLYDPDRAQTTRWNGESCLWHAGVHEIAARSGTRGDGLRVLMEPTASPTIARCCRAVTDRWPGARIFIHDPTGSGPGGSAGRARQALFGQDLIARYDFSRAQIVVAMDADPLASGPWHLSHARGFASLRRARTAGLAMNRLYVAESSPTCTGSIADHRIPVCDRNIVDLLLALMAELITEQGVQCPDERIAALVARRSIVAHPPWIRAAAEDLATHRGAGLIVIGDRQPPLAHALGHALNATMGNVGSTMTYGHSPLIPGDGDLANLVRDLDQGAVTDLLILGGNPVLTSHGDLQLAQHLPRARNRWYLGLYENETAQLCHGFMPQAHVLESWGDACAHDGTRSLQQPLIDPLYGGITACEVLAALCGTPVRALDLVRRTWRDMIPPTGALTDADADTRFAEVLRRGIEVGSASAPVSAVADWSALMRFSAPLQNRESFELSVQLDAKVHDGCFANNPWLQELPDPVTKLTWDNAALISPAAAHRLGVAQDDLIEIRCDSGSITLPVIIQPGQAEWTISVSLGYGRRGSERTAAGIGTDVYPLTTVNRPWSATVLAVNAHPGSHQLAITQHHWSLEGRPILLERTLGEITVQADKPLQSPPGPSLRPGPTNVPGPQWAMVIDTSVCIGCSACVVACQAENNIPVVGKDNVLRSREMHWLRVDRYYRGPEDNPVTLLQPMACQHCEKAPCEYVCPTYATTHSQDGLNEMTYNRCVGTRFCSNNCPYKVRRFNWYNFADGREPLPLARNPQVTVRARGVMEKCTYCVQRIRTTEHHSVAEGVPMRTDVVVTACQQTCPTQAITFGDMNDPASAVARLRTHPLAYTVLEDAGAQPRTRYLAHVRNPHPSLP
jgi:molybdopterin-containing oxidoreductase family iron-sulfur binding subunit